MATSSAVGCAVAMVWLAAAPAFAQISSLGAPAEGAADDSSIPVNVRFFDDRPVRPIIQGVGPGGGPGFGVEYDLPAAGVWFTNARAVVTTRKYWNLQASSGIRGRLGAIEAYGRVRDMSQLSFYGLGPSSDPANQTAYKMRDRVVGTLGVVPLGAWFAIGGRAEAMWPEIGPGRASGEPSIELRFDERGAPGLTAQPRFARYEGIAELDIPAAVAERLHQGGTYRAIYARFDDLDLRRFSFRRIDLEARHRFAVLRPLHRLTLHGWISTTETDAGQQVPFYLQHTLGGRGAVRTLRDDLIGADGTPATLRSFSSLRFRDRHLLLLQAEYRFPVWGPVDVTLFTDAGKVAPRRADLDLSGLRRSHGFSVNVMRKDAAMTRVDVAFGGGEGARVLLAVEGEFKP